MRKLILTLFLPTFILVYGLPALIVFYLRPVTPLGLYGLITLPAAILALFLTIYYRRMIDTAFDRAREAIERTREAWEIAHEYGQIIDKTNEQLKGIVQLETDLDELERAIFPRSKRGRPAGMIYIPGKGNLTVTEALPDLAELQAARERGELRQACETRGIVQKTAERWLREYQEQINEWRKNSG